MESLPPIPTPAAQRWREFRIQVLPVIIFVCIIGMIVMMWRSFVQPSGLVGEVEAVKANVISLHDGIVAELLVDRLQYVTNGQVIGTIIGTDPDILRATIATIEADLKVLRARMRLDENRNQQSLQQLRWDVLNEKMLREIAMSGLTVASNQLNRARALVDHQVESQEVMDIRQAEFDKLITEIKVRTQTITDREEALRQFEAAQGGAEDPVIDEAIKAKEQELELTLKPAEVKAPMAGFISAIYHRGQERVVRGEPIVTISSPMAERIVGYIRQPVQVIPNERDVVVVHTRTMKRQAGEAQILKVGTQFEAINPALISADSNRVEMGLPILVSLPKGMTVQPGEFVDLAIRYAKR